MCFQWVTQTHEIHDNTLAMFECVDAGERIGKLSCGRGVTFVLREALREETRDAWKMDPRGTSVCA